MTGSAPPLHDAGRDEKGAGPEEKAPLPPGRSADRVLPAEANPKKGQP